MQDLGGERSPVLQDFGHEAGGFRQNKSRQIVQEKLCKGIKEKRSVADDQVKQGEVNARRRQA